MRSENSADAFREGPYIGQRNVFGHIVINRLELLARILQMFVDETFRITVILQTVFKMF